METCEGLVELILSSRQILVGEDDFQRLTDSDPSRLPSFQRRSERKSRPRTGLGEPGDGPPMITSIVTPSTLAGAWTFSGGTLAVLHLQFPYVRLGTADFVGDPLQGQFLCLGVSVAGVLRTLKP